MKVLLVFSLEDAQSVTAPLASLEDIQMGISYVSAVLKDRGYTTRLIVLSPTKKPAALDIVNSTMSEYEPDLVGFTSVFSQFPFISSIAQHIKNRWPDKFLVVGGPHATLNPEDAIEAPFDAVCVGEGEYPTAELAEQLAEGRSPQGIANLWIRQKDGSVEKNDTRPFIADLDELPFPDREMWKPWIKEKAGARLSVFLGRGCPFQCTYCSNHALARTASGKYVRFRSPDKILEEIRELTARYPDKGYIYLEVETIALDRKWLFDLCAKLQDFNAALERPIAYGCNFRVTPQSVDREVFAAMKKANFISINIGLESGSERVRREALERKYSNEGFEQAAALAKTNGMRINIYSLIGIPGETFQDHLETIRMNRAVTPDRVIKSIFFPYPGTKLHNICIERGLLPGDPDVTKERRKAVLNLPEFSRSKIQRAYVLFEYRVYKGVWPFRRLLIHTLRNVIKSSPLADAFYLKLVQIPFFDRLRARGEGSINELGTQD